MPGRTYHFSGPAQVAPPCPPSRGVPPGLGPFQVQWPGVVCSGQLQIWRSLKVQLHSGGCRGADTGSRAFRYTDEASGDQV
jgi:hypothetical protein